MSLESLARGLLVLAVLGGWIGTVSVLPSVHELPHPFGLALYTPLAWLTMPAVVMACTVAQVLLLGLWASGRGGLAAVLPSLALVQTYAFVEASFSAIPGDLAGHGKVLPYLVWLGLEVGRAVRPGPAGHALGVELGSGIVGVLYVMGG
ncbi:MAG: hypothetical protein H6732_12755 [Alphaproteobacteria bacterium]|nr:hypothetical protein [Alphaproteobacteria bacterium]